MKKYKLLSTVSGWVGGWNLGQHLTHHSALSGWLALTGVAAAIIFTMLAMKTGEFD